MIGAWEMVAQTAGLAALAGYWLGRAYIDGCAVRGVIADTRIPKAFAVVTALATAVYTAHATGLAQLPPWR